MGFGMLVVGLNSGTLSLNLIQEIIRLICRNCYYLRDYCGRTPSVEDRCRFFIKKGKVKLGDENEIEVSPPDTAELNLSDIIDLFQAK